MKYPFVTYLTLLFCCLSGLQAQEDPIRIEALLLGKNDKAYIADAHIINKTSQKGVLSKTNGLFFLNVNHKDSVLITAMGYKPLYITIDTNIHRDNQLNHIFMEQNFFEITEVKIHSFGDYEKLKYDIKNLHIEDPHEIILQQNIKTLAIKEAVLAMAPPPGLVMRFKTAEEKQLAYLNIIRKESKHYYALREKLPDDIIQRITGLKGDSLQFFINEFLASRIIDEQIPDYELITQLEVYFETYKRK